ncbi:aldo/keto reductase [Tunturiibacter gelidoferens]|jgi:1-deoxyxylulose-5-phosphate synthase|uniref:Aryl-alcohol dehydrogenase-like predicted oxidoreductase n=1 Tax=Tunturiibacter gelidiferens TaxID=3069689 RepID=A0A9X0QBV1_9BACT|nr:aldo/keto reductase [Edaphobacter lichenicola]MBB5327395.1 aryl-alcohol dehydrogenase-like predicted oxidoreductase [Edaphobacter lichenicola]
MLRRDFLRRSTRTLGATLLARSAIVRAALLEPDPLPQKFHAQDEVVLGKTGIRTSRLAMGTGTIGFGGASNQTRLGTSPLTRLLLDGYNDNGLRFFDSADSYGSHPYVAEALKHIPRDKVVVLTKTDTRDAAGVRADLDRFRKELGVDYIDIVLIHCVTEGDWTTRYRGVMDVLSEAKQKGVIRAHGVSCHSLPALKAAAASPWVEVDLVRLNPIGSHMDADPATVISVIKQMRAQGKGIIGMKILGQGDLRDKPAEAIRYALGTGVLDAFTIGAESQKEQNNLIQRVAAA